MRLRECHACGRTHENETLEEKQNLKKAKLRSQPEPGDLVEIQKDHGIIDEGQIGIIGRVNNDGSYEVTFSPQKPFSLERLEKHNALSISGGPVKNIPVEELERTSDVQTQSIHKTKPTGAGRTPQVEILSKKFEWRP